MSERYQRIQAMEPDYCLSQLCAAFEVSRSGYYAWRERAPSARQEANARLVEEMQSIREGEEVCYGSPRLTEELQARGIAGSENRVARLMRAHGLRAQGGRRFVPRTTDSDPDEPIAPNRLAERPAPDGPNQVWLQDLTYVPTQEGWLYLALVLDLWEPANRGLGHGRSFAQRTGGRCAPDGANPAPARPGFAGPLRSRGAIRQPGNTDLLGSARLGGQHEPPRQSL